MRYLGIDYGGKRVGIALSDPSGEFAMPHSVLPRDKDLLDKVLEIIRKEGIGTIVIGESKNFAQERNRIQDKIDAFVAELRTKTEIPIYLEPEFLTTQEAMHMQGDHAAIDASAAALILKSFLSKKK